MALLGRVDLLRQRAVGQRTTLVRELPRSGNCVRVRRSDRQRAEPVPWCAPIPSLRYAYRAPDFRHRTGAERRRRCRASHRRGAYGPRTTSRSPAPLRADAMVARGGLFWDGRANTLQDQAMGPLFNPNEMGNRDVASVARTLAARRLRAAVRRRSSAPTSSRSPRVSSTKRCSRWRGFRSRIRRFIRTTASTTAYLEGRARSRASEWRGLQAFDDPKRGNCAACHLDRPRGDGLPPVFTDYEYEALGIPNDTARARATVDLGACGPLRTDLAITDAVLRHVPHAVAAKHGDANDVLSQRRVSNARRGRSRSTIFATRIPSGSIRLVELPPAYRHEPRHGGRAARPATWGPPPR